jgi:pyruvate kinase
LTTARQKLVKSAVVMANELKAAAILVFTRHGTWRVTPLDAPALFAGLCDVRQRKTANELTLSWGVTPFVMEFDFIDPQNTIETALKNLVAQGRLRTGETVVIIGAISVGTEIVDAVQMRTV